MSDDIARCAQKLHTPPRMVSLMTDSTQRNHPTVAIRFTVSTSCKIRGYRFPCILRVLWSRTDVCYACVLVELTFLFKVLHFQSCIFRSRIFRAPVNSRTISSVYRCFGYVFLCHKSYKIYVLIHRLLLYSFQPTCMLLFINYLCAFSIAAFFVFVVALILFASSYVISVLLYLWYE